MGCTRDAILDALENLTADEFKKFKLKLLSVPLREGYGRIPRGTLMSMDAMDLTDKLVSFYLEKYSAELTAFVLREIGMQETAEKLQEITCKGEHAPSTLCKGPDLGVSSYSPSILQLPPQCLPLGLFHFLFLLPSKNYKSSSACWEGRFPVLGPELGFRTKGPPTQRDWRYDKGRGPLD